MDTSVASLKGPVPSYYRYSGEYSGEESDFKRTVENELRDRFDVLTLTQRSAEWFLQIQMRITASTSAEVLKQRTRFRVILRLQPAQSDPLPPSVSSFQNWCETGSFENAPRRR